MTTTLITGASRGLGFEAARQLAAAGHQVWVGARDISRGEQAADAIGGRFVQLDVTDDASVAAAVETVEGATTASIPGSVVAITAIVSLIIGGGLRVLFAVFMLRGRNWARIVLLIVAVITVLASFTAIVSGDVIQLIALLVVIVAAVLMYLPASNAYFRKRP